MDESSMNKDRRSRRSPVLMAATIEIDSVPHPVKLRNLSEEGALVEGEQLPAEGTTTFFERKELRVRSRIVWVHDRFAGVAFERPLKAEEVLRHVPAPKPAARPEYRRPGLAPQPISAEERKMIEGWMASGTIPPLAE